MGLRPTGRPSCCRAIGNIVAGLSRVRLAGLRKPGHVAPLTPLEALIPVLMLSRHTSHNRNSEPIIDLDSWSPGRAQKTSPAPDSGESGHNKALSPFSCVTECAVEARGGLYQPPA
jgi:hypothetical protein